METISVSLPPAIASRVRRIAQVERRKTSSVVAAALTFYTALPSIARRALDALGGNLTPPEREALQRMIQEIAGKHREDTEDFDL